MTSRVHILALVSMLPLCAAAQEAGVPTEWDVQKLVEGIAAQSGRVLPLIEQIRPKEWVARGASDTYVQQWDSAHSQAASLKLSSENLVREPARLSAALDTYFRLQNLETVLTSLVDGVRKYQNPALADLLRSVMSESSASRQQLRQYLTDLAAVKELEFKVMDQEAQRCRENISRQPVAAPVKKKNGK
jgi:uncharacterized membrane protein YccC